jgi:hypothetical protein
LRTLLLITIFSLCCFDQALGIELTASGGLTRNIGTADLTSGAGSNLNSSYSDAAATSLTVSGTTGASDSWRIDVRKADTSWNGALHLKVRRDTDGSGSGSVAGGNSFIEITGSDSQFFSGAGDRSEISLSYQLTGMAVTIPPGFYNTTVIFTVVGTQ